MSSASIASMTCGSMILATSAPLARRLDRVPQSIARQRTKGVDIGQRHLSTNLESRCGRDSTVVTTELSRLTHEAGDRPVDNSEDGG